MRYLACILGFTLALLILLSVAPAMAKGHKDGESNVPPPKPPSEQPAHEQPAPPAEKPHEHKEKAVKQEKKAKEERKEHKEERKAEEQWRRMNYDATRADRAPDTFA